MNTAAVVLLVVLGLAPAPQNRPPQIQIKSLEKRIFELINMERVKGKVQPLKLDSKLSDIARDHSADMAKLGFFDHVNRLGQSPSDRAKSAGYGCHHQEGRYIYDGIGENILQSFLYSRQLNEGSQIVYEWNNEEELARSTVLGWMGSPGHKANLLSDRYIVTGVGIAISSSQKVLITQDFC